MGSVSIYSEGYIHFQISATVLCKSTGSPSITLVLDKLADMDKSQNEGSAGCLRTVVMPTRARLVNQGFLPHYWKLIDALQEPDEAKRLERWCAAVDLATIKIIYNGVLLTWDQYIEKHVLLHKTSRFQVSGLSMQTK